MTNFKYLYNFLKYFKIYCRENIFSNVIILKVDNLTKLKGCVPMKLKKMIALLLGGILLLFQGVSVQAQEQTELSQVIIGEGIVTPLWTNVNDITLNLYFSSGVAYCSGTIRGLSGTTNISATFKLERKVGSTWVFENAWGQTTSNSTLSFSNSDAVSSGYTYRLSVSANVTRNGVTEAVSSSVEGTY